MGYIDYTYYTSTFKGSEIAADEFPILERIASDVIDLVANRKITSVTENVRKATAYQLELIYRQGGIDAVTGFASSSTAQKESLGDYTVGSNDYSESGKAWSIITINGIPISRLAAMFLRLDGLMSRVLVSVYAQS